LGEIGRNWEKLGEWDDPSPIAMSSPHHHMLCLAAMINHYANIGHAIGPIHCLDCLT